MQPGIVQEDYCRYPKQFMRGAKAGSEIVKYIRSINKKSACIEI
jgi:hypothetical protein